VRVSLVMVCLASLALPAPGQQATPQNGERPAAELVQDLGSPRFARREAAEKALLRLGAKARAALQAGLKSSQAEVKRRCERLLARLDEQEWRRKVDAYVADLDGGERHNLPLREAYEKLAGTGWSARKLFVQCLRQHGPLLRLAAADRPRALAAYKARCRGLALAERRKGGGPPLAAADLATLLLLDVALKAPGGDWKGRDSVAHLFGNEGCYKAVNDRETGAAFRRLLLGWARAEGRSADQASQQMFLYFVDVSNFKEGLGVVWRWARARDGHKGHFRAVAVAVFEKVGGKDVALSLEKLWGDGTVLFALPDKAGGEARLGDQALGASMRLAGKSPRDYGLNESMFAALRGPADRPWQAPYYWFTSDKARQAALKKWKAEAGQVK
jgi:hypothetical protein